jgi:hypothetical protein
VASVIPANVYNQQNADSTWSQVTQWSDGSFTQVQIDPSQYAAYGIPTGTNLPNAIANTSSDLQGGLPTASHDESGLPQNASDPASGSSSKLISTMYYVDSLNSSGQGRIMQKDTYTDGHIVYVDTGYFSYLPAGTAAMTSWDLVGLGPRTQTSSSVPTGQSGAGNQSTPAASDGQTLWQQGAFTQAQFLALYGPNAAQRWAQQHNADLSAGQSAQTTQPASPVAARGTQPAPRKGAMAGLGLTPNQLLIGGGLLAAGLLLSGRRR